MRENINLIISALSLLPGKRKQLGLPVLSLILSNLISFIIPLISIRIIDSIKNTDDKSLDTLIYLFLGWILALMLVILLDYYQNISFRKYGYRAVRQIYVRLMRSLEQQDYQAYTIVNAKEIAEKIKRNLEDILPLYDGGPFVVIRHLIVAFVTLIVMLIINWKLMLAVSLVLPFYFISLILYHDHIKVQYWDYRNDDASFLKKLIEFKQTVSTYKYFSSFRRAANRLIADLNNVIRRQMDLYITLSRRRTYTKVLSSFVPVYLVFVAYIFIIKNQATPGQVFGFWALFSLSVASLGGLSAQYTGLLKALAVYQKIKSDLTLKKQIHKYNIRINSISIIRTGPLVFSYTRKSKSLYFPPFIIKRGDRIQIQGKSGCGKTTLIRLIFGLISPQKGDITINGLPRSDVRDVDFFRHVGYVEQNGILPSGSIMDNVLLGRKFDSKLWHQSIKISGLDQLINQGKYNCSEEIGEAGIQLSGGERQRILLSRALYHQPTWIFLDEPFSGIDSETRQHLEKMISSMSKEITVILISHEHISSLQISGKICLSEHC